MSMTICDASIPSVNPVVVLREEFDDWAVLHNPDTASVFGVNPVGSAVWKEINGQRSVAEIVAVLGKQFSHVPETARQHVVGFLNQLIAAGLASFVAEVNDGRRSTDALAAAGAD
jgi:SynChlorMet cassette protein ScmD